MRKPAPRVVRLVALALLDDARHAARQFRKGDGTDPELLHRFRVSTRRLRSWLQLWRAALADSLSRKDDRRVRRIARATRSARDLDVHLEWLAQRRDAARPARRPDITSIMESLETTRGDAMERARDAAAELEDRHARLARRLAKYGVIVREAEEPEPSFGVALATIVTKAIDELSSHLAAIRTPRNHEAIHEARIAAKRLRYLLEPVVASVPGIRGVVNELRTLQDVAGALHDAQVFSSALANGLGPHVPRAPSLARRGLARQLLERSRGEYARLEQDWLGEAAAPFRARVQRIARRCEREGHPAG